jgi:hypothetical protein
MTRSGAYCLRLARLCIKAFITDPKYTPYVAARQHGSESRLQLIDDTDLAGTISYLPRG